jgi:hypothetical protein
LRNLRHLYLIIGPCVFVPEQIERIKDRLGTSEQKIAELRFALAIQTDKLAIENAAATFQVASQSVTKPWEAFENVPISRHQPHSIFVGTKQRPEAILDLKEPVGMP